MTEIDGIRLQNSLGRLEGYYREDMNMNGFMATARVLRVHHKTGTADIILTNSKDTYSSSTNNEGRFSARILQRGSNYDESRQRYWGSIDPIAEGSLVLVAFLESMKHRPVILGCFHRPDNLDNVYTNQYPLKEKQSGFDRREALKRLVVSPSLSYRKDDGEGNIERTYGSRSFFAMYNTSMDSVGNLSDNHNGFDHEDLSEVDKRTGEVLSADWPEAQAPGKFLFVHRSSFERVTATWTKFFINEKGTFRLTRDNNDGKLSYFEMEENGAMRFRRQLDDTDHGDGEKVTEVTISQEGDMLFKHHTGSFIEFTKDGSVIIHAKNEVITTQDNEPQ